MLTDKFLHIHMPKTAGTTVRGFIQDELLDTQKVTLIRDFGERSVRAAPKDRPFAFGFVRNPWAWYLSRYCWYRKVMHVSGQHDRGNDSEIWDLPSNPISFKEHMWKGFAKDDKKGPPDGNEGLDEGGYRRRPYFGISQVFRDCLCLEDGSLGVDYLGRVETLEKDMDRILWLCGLGVRFGKRNHERVTKHGPYRNYYSEDLRKEVSRRDAEYIDRFGYVF